MVKWNTSSKADELELGKNRETLENKRRKSCGPIYIKPFPAWRKYIMQSGIGEVVLRRETVAGKRWGKMSRITGYIQPNRRLAFFRNCWFRETGSRLRSAKISTPSLVNRNYPTKRNEYIEGGRGGAERRWIETGKFTHAYTFERAFPACFSAFWLKSKLIYSPHLPTAMLSLSLLPSFLPSFLPSYVDTQFQFFVSINLPNSNVDSLRGNLLLTSFSFFF